MISEKYLEYLSLNSILRDYIPIKFVNCEEYHQFNFRHVNDDINLIDLNKLKNRVTMLQKELLEPYVIDSPSKEN